MWWFDVYGYDLLSIGIDFSALIVILYSSWLDDIFDIGVLFEMIYHLWFNLW